MKIKRALTWKNVILWYYLKNISETWLIMAKNPGMPKQYSTSIWAVRAESKSLSCKTVY